mgnify:CR=1 FL=1
MKKQLLFLTCMAVLFGCAKENLPQRPDAAIAVGQAKSRFLTLDSIQQLAAELPECFGEGALTRSGYTKSVADLFPLSDILRSSATKSGETDGQLRRRRRLRDSCRRHPDGDDIGIFRSG